MSVHSSGVIKATEFMDEAWRERRWFDEHSVLDAYRKPEEEAVSATTSSSAKLRTSSS